MEWVGAELKASQPLEKKAKGNIYLQSRNAPKNDVKKGNLTKTE